MQINQTLKAMKKVIVCENAPRAIGPYSQAIEIDGMLFISGQIPLVPETATIVEGGIKEQTERVLQSIAAILKTAGYSLADVVKTTCFLSDMNNFKAMNEVYATFFTENQPARAAFQVARLPLDVLIEIESIAVKSEQE